MNVFECAVFMSSTKHNAFVDDDYDLDDDDDDDGNDDGGKAPRRFIFSAGTHTHTCTQMLTQVGTNCSRRECEREREKCHTMPSVTILCWQFFGFTLFFFRDAIITGVVVVAAAASSKCHTASVSWDSCTKQQQHTNTHRAPNFNGFGHIFQL